MSAQICEKKMLYGSCKFLRGVLHCGFAEGLSLLAAACCNFSGAVLQHP